MVFQTMASLLSATHNYHNYMTDLEVETKLNGLMSVFDAELNQNFEYHNSPLQPVCYSTLSISSISINGP